MEGRRTDGQVDRQTDRQARGRQAGRQESSPAQTLIDAHTHTHTEEAREATAEAQLCSTRKGEEEMSERRQNKNEEKIQLNQIEWKKDTTASKLRCCKKLHYYSYRTSQSVSYSTKLNIRAPPFYLS